MKYLVSFLGFALVAATAASAAEPDFSGVWKLEGNEYQLKPVNGSPIPLTSWGKKELDKNRRALARRDSSVDPTRLRCANPGAVRLMTFPEPIEFLQRPFELVLMFEWNHNYRLVYIGDRPKTAPYEMAAGISNARWDGDTLAVRTTDMTENTWLDSSGLPHGDKTVVTERIRLVAPDLLENVVSVHDEKAFTRDWSFKLRYRKTGAGGIQEDVCLDRIDAGQPAISHQAEK